MPRKLPLFVSRERSRHGKVAFYFRRGKGPRTRLPDIGASDFDAKYLAALNAAEPQKPRVTGVNSLEWLIKRYRETTAYLGLSYATRRQRDNIFKGVVASAGTSAYKSITRKTMMDGRERRASTPAQARNFLDAMRGLFRWALASELVSVDPTAGVDNPRRPKGGDGFPPWTDDDIAAYEARWPAGTKERVWMHVLLYTGLRRGDAVVFGRQHVKDGVATIRTEKSQYQTEASFDIREELAETLSAGPTGDLAFIVGETGKPLIKESFGNFFRIACNAAGVTKSAHGLRKTAAEKAAEAGLSVAELDAMFGWEGGAMAAYYTKRANRKKLARSGSEKIRNMNRPDQNSARPHLKNRV
jgi:integrase